MSIPIPTSKDPSQSIYIADIVEFLKGSLKYVVICVFLGLCAAIVYLIMAPSRYQAQALVEVARASTDSNILSASNLEDPSQLAARLTMPTTFGSSVVDLCRFNGKPYGAAVLPKRISVTPKKGSATTVELIVEGGNPHEATVCADAIVALIAESQAAIAAPLIEEAKKRLLENDRAILTIQQELVRPQSTANSLVGVVYLANQGRIANILDESAVLKRSILSLQTRGAHLIAPIYVGDAPIYPKKINVIAAGLIGGLILGLFFSLAQKLMLRQVDGN